MIETIINPILGLTDCTTVVNVGGRPLRPRPRKTSPENRAAMIVMVRILRGIRTRIIPVPAPAISSKSSDKNDSKRNAYPYPVGYRTLRTKRPPPSVNTKNALNMSMNGLVQMDVMEGATFVTEGKAGIVATCCWSGGIDDEADGITGMVGLRGEFPALLSLPPITGDAYCVGAEAGFIAGAGGAGSIGGSAALVWAVAS
jgi:hypothetical protein